MADRPGVPWVRELVRKRRLGPSSADAAADPSLAFNALRTALWREIAAAVGTYNDEVGREDVIAGFHPYGHITLAKHAFPAGYLDVIPARDELGFVVTVKLRRDAESPVVERTFEGGVVVRDGVARPVWFGAELEPAEIVRRILAPFLDEI